MSGMVYLAGSSLEMDRARHLRKRLLNAGITVVSTWIESIERAGAANPRDATPVVRRGYATGCIDEVLRADVAWFLVPDVPNPTRGAWAELGIAYMASKPIVLSGDTKQSVFCALGAEFESDEDAFREVLRLARGPAVLR